MEQTRLLIAVVLSFLVFLAWEAFFVKNEKPAPKDKTQVIEAKKTGKKETIEKKPGTEPAALEKAEIPAASPQEKAPPINEQEKILTIDTQLFELKISNIGAVFQSFRLKKYRETVEEDSPWKQIIAEKNPNLGLNFQNGSIQGLSRKSFQFSGESDHIEVTSGQKEIVYSYTEKGIEVKKIFIFKPDSYLIHMKTIISNLGETTFNDRISLSLTHLPATKKSRYGFIGPCGLIGGTVEEIKPGNLEKDVTKKGDIQWIAYEDQYFMSAVIQKKPVKASMIVTKDENDRIKNTFVLPSMEIPPGKSRTFSSQVFFGPKSLSLLGSIGYNLDKAIDFGWFDFIAKPCLWLMNFLYGFIPNYGVVIIILTILVKLVMWPIGNKGYKSMDDMKRLQPLMTEIREKYKNDKKKMNEEVMNLYRTYKINPMGGCLPMVLQIPVFFALYRMLYEAIELRHAPFFGWITDLSAPDRLFHFDFTIPFMEPPYGIPVLTIVMGVTMFFQQKMSPPPGDPTQAKIMVFLPIIFTFIFINFSSGLVLYWMVSNLLSISQQYYVSKKVRK